MSARGRTRTFDVPMGEPGPQPGDLLATALRLYLVRTVEPVETRIRCDRWRLNCQLLAKRGRDVDPWPTGVIDQHVTPGCRWWNSTTYRRGEPPSSVWGSD